LRLILRLINVCLNRATYTVVESTADAADRQYDFVLCATK
jgi:hypothetical protein